MDGILEGGVPPIKKYLYCIYVIMYSKNSISKIYCKNKRSNNLPQLRRALIVKVLYKQANIGFAAEVVFFGGGKGGVSPPKRVERSFRGLRISEKKNSPQAQYVYCKLL